MAALHDAAFDIRRTERDDPVPVFAVLAGVLLIITIGEPMRLFFGIVNARMLSVPSVTMDVYNQYFAQHELTHFCQIWLLKPFVSCALKQQISVEMKSTYRFPQCFLVRHEGIASVGL
ncbi:hypothetical protein [Bradyrhizobium sp. 151]|uniref:hypothetical protein n=1 Tax=Bradyrhizobium sp. 151 TaxID=2782626 RepID=UPI001FFAE5A7|nr:hypothetical protein [Bradyrhizobium sp. 151]MCK1660617.1 hypothetical protein [Bradyrhizobium sp. 151]